MIVQAGFLEAAVGEVVHIRDFTIKRIHKDDEASEDFIF